jgi:hypothetical protein
MAIIIDSIKYFFLKESANKMTKVLIKKGMNQSPSSNWFDIKKIYLKASMTAQGIKNDLFWMNLGSGVKLLFADLDKGIIEVKGGHSPRHSQSNIVDK